MKNIFGILGILLFLKSLEDVFMFYSLIFDEPAKISLWTAANGVLGTAIFFYFLFIIGKIILNWVYYVPELEE